MKKLIISLLFIFMSIPLFAQRDLEKELGGYRNPEEMVTFSENLSFSKAVEILNKVSEKTTGKTVVSTVPYDSPIGIQITQMPFKKALTMIVQYANLMFEEKTDIIVIKSKTVQTEKSPSEIYAPVNTREVKISAVFFEADVSNMRNRGINWQFLLAQKGVTLGTSLASTATTQGTGFDLNAAATSFSLGKFAGDATELFRIFEEENLGEIIASPSITVRNGQAGRIQIGSDFSTKIKDFSGNVVEKFFSSGSIIEVTPFINNEDNIDYVLLKLNLERSSAFPSEVSTEIRKTSATTQVLMLNHEETVIGGLYINEETKVRNGIPILKDLPWWVFGIRYLTGSEQVDIRKKEVVILLKVELLPTLKERVNAATEENKLRQELNSYKEKLEQFKSQNLNQTKENK
ncbi:MAG: hypothetical protein WCJ01_00810 [Ignavibacteria bacterium]